MMLVLLSLVVTTPALKIVSDPIGFDIADMTYDEDCGDRYNYKCWKKGGHSLDRRRPPCASTDGTGNGELEECNCIRASSGLSFVCTANQVCHSDLAWAVTSQHGFCAPECGGTGTSGTATVECACFGATHQFCQPGETCAGGSTSTLRTTCVPADCVITTSAGGANSAGYSSGNACTCGTSVCEAPDLVCVLTSNLCSQVCAQQDNWNADDCLCGVDQATAASCDAGQYCDGSNSACLSACPAATQATAVCGCQLTAAIAEGGDAGTSTAGGYPVGHTFQCAIGKTCTPGATISGGSTGGFDEAGILNLICAAR